MSPRSREPRGGASPLLVAAAIALAAAILLPPLPLGAAPGIASRAPACAPAP